MDLKEIYQLWDRFENSTVSEMDLEFQGMHFILKKSSGSEKKVVSKEMPGSTPVQDMEVPDISTCIKAPLVGTFYQASAPGQAPFVTVGQQIHKGDVVGIIEAMKLMNEITAPEDGIVTAIHVKDGDMVEYNQVLMELK